MCLESREVSWILILILLLIIIIVRAEPRSANPVHLAQVLSTNEEEITLFF
jgi:hypothetical protein